MVRQMCTNDKCDKDCDKCFKRFFVKTLPEKPCKNAIYFVKTSSGIDMYVTDILGQATLIASSGQQGAVSITSNGSISIQQVEQSFNINVSQTLQNLINGAIQPGDNISELTNDSGYITNSDVTLQVATQNGNTTNQPIISTLNPGFAFDAQGSIRTQGFSYANTFEAKNNGGGFRIGGGATDPNITSTLGDFDSNVKIKYKPEVATTFSGRQIPDVNFVQSLIEEAGNYVPLSGTVEGQPITGDLEFDTNNIGGVSLKSNNPDGNNGSFGGVSISDEGKPSFFYRDLLNNLNTDLIVTEEGISVISNNSDSKGITSSTYFDKQGDPNAFAQMQDLQNASSTNLTFTPSSSQGTIVSSSGTDAVIPLANSTQAGLVSYERYVYNNPQTLDNPVAESMYGSLSSEGWILNNTAVEQEKLLQSININTAASGTINFAIGIIDQRGIFLARLEFTKTVVNGSNNIIFNELMKKFEVLAVKLPISANLIGSTYNIDGKLMYTPDGYSGELSGQPYDLNIQLNLQDAIRNPLVFENQLQQLDDRVVILENEGLTTTSPDGTVYEFTANNDGEIEVGGLSYSSVVHLGNSLALHPWSLDENSYWWGNWGMAASEKEKDYVHQFKSILEESGGTVDNDVYTIVEWEWNYATWDKAQLIPMIEGKELVVIRLGENVSYAPDFKAEFKELLQYILDYNPAVKLLVGGLFWFNELKETAMREATLELGLPFVQLYQLNTTENQSYIGAMVYGEDGELHEITVSGVAEHPGDLGMQRIAETLFSGLGANMKKPLAYKEDVLLKENASEDPQPYTDNIIPLRTEDGSLKMTRVMLTEPDIFTDNMTAAVGMFNNSNMGVKFSALALKKFINAETTQGLSSKNNQQTNTLTTANASLLAFGSDGGIAFGQGGAVRAYLPISQSIDNSSNPVDQIINPSGGNVGFGKIPTEKVDVSGNLKANNLITNNATASNHAVALGQIPTEINKKINGGTASFTGDNTTITFNIPHGLSGIPQIAVTRRSDEDVNQFQAVANATNIVVTFVGGVPMTGNVTEVNWLAFLL